MSVVINDVEVLPNDEQKQPSQPQAPKPSQPQSARDVLRIIRRQHERRERLHAD